MKLFYKHRAGKIVQAGRLQVSHRAQQTTTCQPSQSKHIYHSFIVIVTVAIKTWFLLFFSLVFVDLLFPFRWWRRVSVPCLASTGRIRRKCGILCVAKTSSTLAIKTTWCLIRRFSHEWGQYSSTGLLK